MSVKAMEQGTSAQCLCKWCTSNAPRAYALLPRDTTPVANIADFSELWTGTCHSWMVRLAVLGEIGAPWRLPHQYLLPPSAVVLTLGVLRAPNLRRYLLPLAWYTG